MQNGSHSRNSYPLDKMVPKTIIRGTNKDRVPPGATIKKMHKKKQRQYPVYNENYVRQEGLISCGKCFGKS